MSCRSGLFSLKPAPRVLDGDLEAIAINLIEDFQLEIGLTKCLAAMFQRICIRLFDSKGDIEDLVFVKTHRSGD